MNTEADSRTVRVHGEVIVLHCWACGTAHSVSLELCRPLVLGLMVCSNSNCRMSLFLINELFDDGSIKQPKRVELTSRIYPRFWR
jgi:translation initiation factor 2 beta subunit (eIF-2beta)/eIF-5